jgi:hypothetical protein
VPLEIAVHERKEHEGSITPEKVSCNMRARAGRRGCVGFLSIGEGFISAP